MNPTPREPLANRLANGEELLGVIMKMSSPASAELAGHLGFDLLVIDTEHGIAGGAELDHHLRAGDSAGIPSVVRIGNLNRPEIARALDGGAAGIIVPQVDDAVQASEAIRLAHYPPFGARGLATSTRAGHQSVIPGGQHIATARAETVVILQIESSTGVANAAEIVATEGVSAIWLGLSDLSLELGHFGDTQHPEVVAAIDTVLAATAAAGIPLIVIADNEADGRYWIERGAQVLFLNLLNVLIRGLTELAQSHRQSWKSERIERAQS